MLLVKWVLDLMRGEICEVFGYLGCEIEFDYCVVWDLKLGFFFMIWIVICCDFWFDLDG